MSQPGAARFFFAFGHPECQRLLKREVELRYPELRLAFSRPGLVTFKAIAALEREFSPRLALVAGESLGSFATADALRVALAERSVAPRGVRTWQQAAEGAPSSSLPPFVSDAVRVDERGEVHLDVLLLGAGAGEGGASEAWFGVSRDPSGARRFAEPVAAPEGAPSRAYSKLEEVIRATGLALTRGQRVLELGAAPGGASLALLERGLEVIAVDPGEMAGSLAPFEAAAGLRHVKKAAGQLVQGDLGGARSIDWLVSDVNLAPPVAATQIAHAWSLVKKTARGAILTIKMNDERALEALPGVERRLSTLLGGALRVLHLPSHRREVALVIQRRV